MTINPWFVGVIFGFAFSSLATCLLIIGKNHADGLANDHKGHDYVIYGIQTISDSLTHFETRLTSC